MKKRVYLAGIVFILSAAVAIRIADSPPAAAAVQKSHSTHGTTSAPHPEEEMKDHFEHDEHAERDEHDEHAEHGGHDEHAERDGHDEHAERDEHDEHAEHGGHDEHGEAAHEDTGSEEDPHAEHAGHDSHEGHGHEAHDSHGDHGGICPEHRVPEEEDALCHGDHIGELQPGEGMKVRLASPDAAERAGVRLIRPQTTSLAGGTAIPGRVQFNRNRLARITPLASGVIRQVRIQPGARVSEGEVLAEVAMPEVAALKGQLLAARAGEIRTESTYRREKDLLERGISSRQEFQQAESDYHSARSAAAQYRQQLLNFGLSQDDIGQLLRTGDSSAKIPLRAPFAGTVVEVNTALGEAVEPGTPLFTVADLDRLWVELSLPESRIYQAREGAPLQARFDGLPGRTFSGRIFQVGASVDPRTRTLKALAEVDNPGHRLKAGMFGEVRLLEGDEEKVLTLPADSLQSIDGLSFVFVRQGPDLFELRRVRAGAKTGGAVPILAGLAPGEQVVSGQGFALKSEVLKARLGASCADH